MVEARVDVGCAAARAWELLADVRRVPEWVPGVADAVVIESEPGGRPLVVRFVSMPSSAAVDYVLRYGYDDRARTLRWWTVDAAAAERGVEGEARVDELGEGRCRLAYALASWSTRALPGWARDALAGDTPERAAAAFRRWAEATP